MLARTLDFIFYNQDKTVCNWSNSHKRDQYICWFIWGTVRLDGSVKDSILHRMSLHFWLRHNTLSYIKNTETKRFNVDKNALWARWGWFLLLSIKTMQKEIPQQLIFLNITNESLENDEYLSYFQVEQPRETLTSAGLSTKTYNKPSEPLVQIQLTY